MKFEISERPIEKISADVIILFAYQGKKDFLPTTPLSYVDKKLNGLLVEEMRADGFLGKTGEKFYFHTHRKFLGSRVAVVGLGKREDTTSEVFRESLASIAKEFRGKVNSFLISPLSELDTHISVYEQSKSMGEGVLLGTYTFGRYKKQGEHEKDLEVVVFSSSDKSSHSEIKKGYGRADSVYRGVKVARDLVNEQSATATPAYLAKLAEDIARGAEGITCRVYDHKEIKKMGMEAFLGVARASLEETPPKFIYLHYKPKKKARKKVAVVGKGITFDTGGVSLKPAQYMTSMKCDMSGAATVLGLFSVISEVSPDVEVMGLIAATPNFVSAKAYVPGDILRAMNGKTIEVLNTDAEGRITLADALSFAVKRGADEVVDLATLTGACVVALGEEYSGLFTNNKDFASRFMEATVESGEKIWEMPLPETYKKLIKSPIADVANIGSTPFGGAITAALFLQEFVEETPWIHLDIAGPAFFEKDHPLGPKGGSGFGVSTLISYLSNIQK